MRESAIEKHLVKLIKARGGEVRKVRFLDRQGAPDRLVLFEGGVLIWVELKATTGKVSAAQRREHERLKAMGQRVEVFYSISEIDYYFKVGE